VEEGRRVQLNHLYLVVSDLDRPRDFYARYFGFDGPSEWQAETFVVRNAEGFSLALTPDASPPEWPSRLHFGFLVDDVDAVRSLLARLQAEGVRIVESIAEPAFAVFKCLDPDGYVVEVEAGVPGGM
jgi:catechol 2,3-dioxygenase-like lactoylglutathione lyase family enzyme